MKSKIQDNEIIRFSPFLGSYVNFNRWYTNLCTFAVLQQAAPLTLVPCALSFMVGSVGLQT